MIDELIERFFAESPIRPINEKQKAFFLAHLLAVPVERREAVMEYLLSETQRR